MGGFHSRRSSERSNRKKKTFSSFPLLPHPPLHGLYCHLRIHHRYCSTYLYHHQPIYQTSTTSNAPFFITNSNLHSSSSKSIFPVMGTSYSCTMLLSTPLPLYLFCTTLTHTIMYFFLSLLTYFLSFLPPSLPYVHFLVLPTLPTSKQ